MASVFSHQVSYILGSNVVDVTAEDPIDLGHGKLGRAPKPVIMDSPKSKAVAADTINSVPILLLDGGLGTTLSEAPFHIKFDQSTPLWSSHLILSSPSTLSSVHGVFLSAGAEILQTATYQASLAGFARTPRLGNLLGCDANAHAAYTPVRRKVRCGMP